MVKIHYIEFYKNGKFITYRSNQEMPDVPRIGESIWVWAYDEAFRVEEVLYVENFESTYFIKIKASR